MYANLLGHGNKNSHHMIGYFYIIVILGISDNDK